MTRLSVAISNHTSVKLKNDWGGLRGAIAPVMILGVEVDPEWAYETFPLRYAI